MAAYEVTLDETRRSAVAHLADPGDTLYVTTPDGEWRPVVAEKPAPWIAVYFDDAGFRHCHFPSARRLELNTRPALRAPITAACRAVRDGGVALVAWQRRDHRFGGGATWVPVDHRLVTPRPGPEFDDEPVHTWFGLSYSHYAVVPRVLAQSMPLGWQRRFVRVMNELREAFEHVPQASCYDVQAAIEVEAADLTEAQMAATGVTRDREEDYDGTEHEVFHDRDGDELQYDSRVLVHVPNPLPPYNRGRTRVPTRFEVEGGAAS